MNNYFPKAVFSNLHVISSWFHHNTFIIEIVLIILLFILLIGILRNLLSIRKLLTDESIFLEITPPALTEKTAYTTQQLFSVLHNAGMQKNLMEKLLGRKVLFSFEIVSKKEEGIKYVVRSNEEQAHVIERMIVSYVPQVRVKRISDYLSHHTQNSKIISFALKKHFAFPLAKQEMLNEHDPVAYITGMMTKLAPGEMIALQLVISPTKKDEATLISRRILRNEDVLNSLRSVTFPWFLQPFSFLFLGLIKILQVIGTELSWALSEVTQSTSNRQLLQLKSTLDKQNQLISNNMKPARVLSSFEQEAVTAVQEKVNQALFETSLRVYIAINDKQEQNERIRGIKSSFAPFSVPMYQSLYSPFTLPLSWLEKIRLFTFKKRLLSVFRNKSDMLLSISEIADLYHFPYSKVTQTENIVKVHSKELPAPLSLKNNPNLDVAFAKNTYGGSETPIGMTEDERVRHMYVIGATGTGKTTMLLSMINQDVNNGKGVCVIDPHGDLAESILQCVPSDRIQDVIYFNPQDIQYPIGINLLELTPGLSEDEALIEKEFIAESVISLFRKVFSDSMSAHPHRIEYILRNTIHTAFTLENPTLFTIFELLNNPPFQKRAIQSLQDEHLKNFWKYEFGKAGDFQKVKMVAPVTARIGRFLFSPSAKRILEQEKSTINFDDILSQKKILICNLSKGAIGEDTSEVMGIMLLNKIQLAILKRAKIEKNKRTPFYLYVDEFQNFATPSFVQMLSESRKYGLSLTMAEQSTSQQKDKTLVQIVLANAGTVVTFRSANPKDEEILLPQYRPYIEPGEIMNLPSFHFYMKKAALKPEEPFSGKTLIIPIHDDSQKYNRFIQASRNNYAVRYEKKAVMNSSTRSTASSNDTEEESNKKPSMRGILPMKKKKQ